MSRFRFSLANLMCVPVVVAILCLLYRRRSYLEALPLTILIGGLAALMIDRASRRPFWEGFVVLGTVYPILRTALLVITPNAGHALLDDFLAMLYLGHWPVAFEPYGSKNWDYFQAGGHVAMAFVIAMLCGLTFALARRLQRHQQPQV